MSGWQRNSAWHDLYDDLWYGIDGVSGRCLLERGVIGDLKQAEEMEIQIFAYYRKVTSTHHYGGDMEHVVSDWLVAE